jgi:hypothetical protein
VSVSRFSDCRLSKFSLQIRANHLARELHSAENRWTEHVALWPSQIYDSGNPREEQLTRNDSDEVEVVSPPRSEVYTDVEIVESWLTATKRKHDSTSNNVLDKKHRAA